MTVTIEGDRITSVEVGENKETETIGSVAIEQIPGEVVAANSLDVDLVSGATHTSIAILTAIDDCLQQAGTKWRFHRSTSNRARAASPSLPLSLGGPRRMSRLHRLPLMATLRSERGSDSSRASTFHGHHTNAPSPRRDKRLAGGGAFFGVLCLGGMATSKGLRTSRWDGACIIANKS